MRTELYINNTLVDLKEDVQVALTYAIADIRNPEKRNGSYSKTVVLPGTAKVNQLFTSIFQIDLYIQTSGIINFVPDFNPNLKATAVLYTDGLEQFRGFIKLDKIRRVNELWHKIEYDVNFFGDVSTIFGNLNDAKLTDLNFSDLDHSYTKAVQKATWGQTVGSGYLYRMIDYGANPPAQWDTLNFFPGIYLKEYIDRIFSYAGFVYDSGRFFDSDFFKHLFIPFNGDKLTLTSAQIAAMLFASTKSTSYTPSVNSSSPTAQSNPVVFDNETTDPSNQYNPATGIFTAATNGYYDFYTSGVVYAVTNGTTQASVNVSNVTAIFNFYKNTSTLIPGGYYNFQMNPGGTYTGGTVLINNVSCQAVSPTIYMNAGDTMQISIQVVGNIQSGQIDFTISSLAYKNRITNPSIVEGSTVSMNSAIPVDIKQGDLLMSVIRMFNLFVEPDRTQPNKLYVDTYSSFYGSGTTRDWTSKIDMSQEMEIIPMGALDARRYRISYKSDNDYWNKLYTDKWGEVYGEFFKDITNDFLKNINNNEVIFSPTIMRGDNSHDRIVPTIYSMTSSGVPSMIKSNIRLLYDGGTYNTLYQWLYTSTSGNTNETTYPYCGHLDNPYNPTLDLCFDVPREVFWVNPYGDFHYTNANLYNQYFKAFIDEITDRNSKIIIAYFFLNTLDILRLSFRDKIFIDGNYYRLNRIIDYSPVSTKTTKVELLKINAAVPYTAVNKIVDFASGGTIGANRSPTNGNTGGSMGNIGDASLSSANLMVGTANYVSGTSRSSAIVGSSNRVGEATQNVSIIASSGVTIAPGLKNVTVFNTNDVNISDSNVAYFNGIRYQATLDIITLTSVTTIENPGTYYANGTFTITLSSKIGKGGEVRIIDITSGVHTLTISGGGFNINGSGSFTSTVQYSAFNITWDGSQFYKLQ